MNSKLGKELLEAGRFVEVTEEIVALLKLKDGDAIAAIDGELAYRSFYRKHGVVIQVVWNHISCVTQRYIQDINA